MYNPQGNSGYNGVQGVPRLPHMEYKECKTDRIGVGFRQGRRYWRVQTETMSLQKARKVMVGQKGPGTMLTSGVEQWTGVEGHTLFLYGARE